MLILPANAQRGHGGVYHGGGGYHGGYHGGNGGGGSYHSGGGYYRSNWYYRPYVLGPRLYLGPHRVWIEGYWSIDEYGNQYWIPGYWRVAYP